MPSMPRLEMLNVLPCSSLGVSFFASARFRISVSAVAISLSVRWCASRITGTSKSPPLSRAMPRWTGVWNQTPSSRKLALSVGWRGSNDATTRARMAVIDGRYGSRSRSCIAALSSTSIASTNWGMVALIVRRCAMILRPPASGTSRPASGAPAAAAATGCGLPTGAAAGAGASAGGVSTNERVPLSVFAGATAAAAGAAGCDLPFPAGRPPARSVSTAWRTSSLRMRPCGPPPASAARSNPCSRAIFRARGVARGRGPAPCAAVAGADADGRVASGADGAAVVASGWVAGGPSWSRLSPFSRINAITVATGTVVPFGAVIRTRVPLAGASTSIVALSVSMSKSGSPAFTLSPSDLYQLATVPSSMTISTLGIITSTGMALLLYQTTRGDGDVLDLRHRAALELPVVRDRRFAPGQPADRRVEEIEGIALGQPCGNFAAESAAADRLIHDQDAPGFPRGLDQRCFVQRPQRPHVDHFKLDPVPGQLLRRLQRAAHHHRIRDDRRVLAGPPHHRLAQRLLV